MNKDKIGKLGEEISVIFLKKKGFKIIDRNWKRLPIGEIDIVAERKNIYYFVEVKSSAYSDKITLEHMDSNKIKKFEKIVRKYLIENNLLDKDFKLSVILVYLNSENKKAKINFIENFY